MPRNPFGDKPEAKKRIVAVSLTYDQQEALKALQSALELPTQSAVVKEALRRLHDEQTALPVTDGRNKA